MNVTILMGRTTKDIEVKEAGNTKVANFSLAVNRDYKREGQPDADFFDCTVFGKTAEFMGNHVKKGQQILVRGTLQNNAYTDKEGKKRVNTVVMVNTVEFAGPKPSGADSGADASPVVDEDDAIPFA